jgi:hypothetical protein
MRLFRGIAHDIAFAPAGGVADRPGLRSAGLGFDRRRRVVRGGWRCVLDAVVGESQQSAGSVVAHQRRGQYAHLAAATLNLTVIAMMLVSAP